MPSDYSAIARDNVRRRGEEFDDTGDFLATQFYSDRTHFIYELLQNAEDALARRDAGNPRCGLPNTVSFTLWPDCLEVRHYGQPFNKDNVRGISDILKGTSENERNQIGKFGIGFKSVYAFTASPEVHSGDEHFRIERYIRPTAADPRETKPGETLFVLPLDRSDVPADQARPLIRDRLKKLDPWTLLFLRHIEKIEWSHGTERGVYSRETKGHTGHHRRVTLMARAEPDATEAREEWLVFDRTVPPPLGQGPARIEVAYQVVTDPKSREDRIERVADSPLVVFFPTGKETRLGFLVQGPYHTTAARDNVLHDHESNKALVQETATLVVDALGGLKEMGLLTVGVLQAMPIRPADFLEESMFRPVFDRVRQALRTQPLLPAQDGTFVAGNSAKLARGADLCNLLGPDQLQELCAVDAPVGWLPAEITESATRELRDYVIQELGVEEIEPLAFARKLTKDFLKHQSDEWMAQFYGWLNEHGALWRADARRDADHPSLRNKEIIRLETDEHVVPFKPDGSPNAFLPPKTHTQFPVVKRAIANDSYPDAMKFLRQGLRLAEPDSVDEVVEHILPKYRQPSAFAAIGADEHARDVQAILRAMKTDSQQQKNRLVAELRKTACLRAVNAAAEKHEYREPEGIYFRTPALELYFEGNENAWFLDEAEQEDHAFVEMRVKRAPIIESQAPGQDGHVTRGESYRRHKRGLKGFDWEAKVDGLDHALATPSREKAAFVWNTILRGNARLIRGEVQECWRAKFDKQVDSHGVDHSPMGKTVTERDWLPEPEGVFQKPSKLTLEDLPDEFVKDRELADQLGMKKSELRELARRAGCPEDCLDEFLAVANDPQEREDFRQYREQRKQAAAKSDRADFPDRPVPDAERREAKVKEELENAPPKTYEIRERSVSTSDPSTDPHAYLRGQYTRPDGRMCCQMCDKEMPFKKRDREYYFEAVQVADDFPKEFAPSHLALCPNCAALYKVWVKGKGGEAELERVKQALREQREQDKRLKITLDLDNQERTLTFSDAHRLDLRTALRQIPPRTGTVIQA